MPGHGESYETCGKPGLKVCRNLDEHPNGQPYVKFYVHSCGRAECPICYERWAALEAHRAMRRFEAARIRTLIHVQASPPPGKYDKGTYEPLRKAAYQVVKRVGVKGGVCVFHPFRKAAGEWYFSPHFHVLGYGWISGTADEYQRSGWVVKNLGVRKSVYRTLQYQLSHAGVWVKGCREEGEGCSCSPGILPIAKSKVHTITWFGTLSYAKLHVEPEEFEELCPLCGRELRNVEWTGEGDPPPHCYHVSSSHGRMYHG